MTLDTKVYNGTISEIITSLNLIDSVFLLLLLRIADGKMTPQEAGERLVAIRKELGEEL